MSDIIRFETVMKGIRCCLLQADCLSCPYRKFNGKVCRKKLFTELEITLIALRGS